MKPEALSDEEIVAEIIATRNTRLFEVLYDRHAGKVYNKCFSFVHDSALAEDVTHDIFLKVYISLKAFEGRSKFSTWVYAITYNFCVDLIRSKKKAKETLDDYQREVELQSEPSDEELFRIQIDKLNTILDLIDPADKSILLMKYQDDFSLQEIADSLGVGLSAVKMRLSRAKEKVVEECEVQDRKTK